MLMLRRTASWRQICGFSAVGLRVAALLAIGAGLAFAEPAIAQDFATPTVGDSPTALQLCRRAEDLRDSNPLESARLVQRLLNEFADRLVAVEGDADRFAPASMRAMALLRSSPRVLDAWREVMAPTVARLVDEGDLEELAMAAPFTPEGVDAALRLAQRDLEAGRPASALTRIASFEPELAANARARAFALVIRARAAQLVGAADVAANARSELDALVESDASLAPIALGLGTIAAAAPGAATATLDDSPSWPRIWRLPLPHSPYSRRYLNPVDGPLLTVPTAAQALDDGSLLTVAPVVDGDRVYLSEGHVVSAVDRLSRRVRWKKSLTSGEDLEVAPIADRSELTVAGDLLIVLTGHGAERRRTGGGRVVALERETGEVRWERSFATLEPLDPDGSEGLFPHGAAVAVDDTLVVMARKVNARQESVASLVGLEIETGRPRWLTYLAGAGSRPMSNMRGFGHPVVHEGAIFVSSAVGAVARIEPSTGSIRWLVRSPVPVTDITAPPLPWENGAPIPTPAGLLAISPDQTSLMVLDPQTGAERRTIPLGRGEAWGAPRYLVSSEDGQRVIAVGDDVLLFDSTQLDRRRWSLSASLAEVGIGPARAGIRGRIAFVDGVFKDRPAVLVPLADRVLIVDSDDGKVVRSIETGRPGNPVLGQGQLLLSAADRIDCFMPLAGAERAVRDWMARDPDDATRALALLELGIQCGVAAMMFEGASTAAAALDRADDDSIRSELVARILAGGVTEGGLGEAEVRRLLALAERTAHGASDRVSCALAEGDWERQRGRVEPAIDAWQRILASAELRSASITTSDSSVPAPALALSRMASALAANGPAVLAGRERSAEAALRQLGPAPRLEALLEHARAWMGSASASTAAISAASIQVADGSAREGFMLLADALRQRSRLAGADAAARSLIGAISALSRERDWHAPAGVELLSLLDRVGRAPLASQEATNAVTEALRSVDPSSAAVRAVPTIGTTAGTGTQRESRLALLSSGAHAERPLDRALFLERSERPGVRTQLALRSSPSHEAIWEAPIDVDDPEVLSFNEEVILWQRGPGVEPSILSLSASDGSRRWVIPSVPELFDRSRIGAAGSVSRRGTRDARFNSPQEVVPFRADPWIVVVRRNGDIACIDSRDGATRWRRDGVAEDFTGDLSSRAGQVAANAMIVAVGGSRRVAGGAALPSLTVLDASNGQTISTVDLAAVGEVEWVTIAPGPLILAGVRNSILAFQPGAVQPIWIRTDHRLGGAVPGIAVQDSIIMVAQRPGARREELISVGLFDGSIESERFSLPPRRGFGNSRLGSLQRLDDAIVAGFTDRVVLFDTQGRTVGQDAVAAEHTYSHVLGAQGTLVAIDPSRSFLANPDRSGSSQPSAVLYLLSRREGGRLVTEPIAVPVGDQSADRWLLLDGAIVGSGLDWSTVVPLGSDSPR